MASNPVGHHLHQIFRPVAVKGEKAGSERGLGRGGHGQLGWALGAGRAKGSSIVTLPRGSVAVWQILLAQRLTR